MFQPAFFFGPLIGLVGGVFVGATGIGGAAIVTPMLVLGLGLPTSTTIATDVVFCAVIKLFGVSAHKHSFSENRQLLLGTLAGSIPGVLVGVAVLALVRGDPAGEAALTKLLGALVLVAAFSVFKKLRFELPNRLIVPISFGVGVLVGMTGVGAGSLFLPLLLGAGQTSFRSAVAVTMVQGLLLSTVAGLAHMAAGSVDFVLLLSLVLGGVPGVLLGARLHDWINVSALARGTAVLLAFAGLRLIL